MTPSATWRIALILAGIGVLLLGIQGFVQPAGADAADDLVREISSLKTTLENTNRALQGIQGELETLRRSVEGSGILDVDQTSSSGGQGIPIVIQNP